MNNPKKLWLSLGSCALALGMMTSPAPAADITWGGGGGNNRWDNSDNWRGGVRPTTGDNVIIQRGIVEAYAGNLTMQNLYLSDSEFTDASLLVGTQFTVKESSYLGYKPSSKGIVTVSGLSDWITEGTMYVGYEGNGTLDILAGHTVRSGPGNIASQAGSVGLARINGTNFRGRIGADWTNTGDLYVGGEGHGTLIVEAGGSVHNELGYLGRTTNSTGAATVTGTGSTWTSTRRLAVGLAGNGTLDILDGGHVINGDGGIALSPWSTSVATVSGNGSRWTNNGDLAVGDWGNGTLNIQAGGLVSNTEGRIGNAATSVGAVTVTGSDSAWNNSGDLQVGVEGHGTLNIEAGGTVSNNSGSIGDQSTSTGVATVTGDGSTWINSGGLTVGDSGNGTLNVEAGGAVTNNDGYIGRNAGSTGVVTVTGDGSTWTNSGLLGSLLIVGFSGDGTLNVEAGGAVSNTDGNIGYGAGSTGVATVTGADSTWTTSSVLIVGRSGNGTLNVEAGGAVSNANGFVGGNAGSTGVATVAGAGSTWTNSSSLTVGASGTGSLNVLDSGAVEVAGLFKVSNSGTVNLDGGSINANGGLDNTTGGTLSHDHGSLTVRGGAFAPNAGGPTDDYAIDGADALDSPRLVIGSGATTAIGQHLYVGDAFNGNLRVEAGGAVNNTTGFLGNNPGSTGVATVTGTGSTWHNTGDLLIGNGGSGTLNIQDGGTVNNAFGLIGIIPGSSGIVTVNGPGSTWNNANTLSVGTPGNGTLNIQDDGTVNAHANLMIGNAPSSNGSVNLQGGTLDLHGTDITQGAGSANFNFTDGILKNVGVFNVGAALVQQGGTLAPGASPGTTQIVGDYNLISGSIEIELAGVLQGTEHDFVDITGTLNLGATSELDIVLINAFVPVLGDSFDILDFASVTGGFNAVNLPALTTGLTWDTSNLYTDGIVSVVVPEPATLTLLGLGGLMMVGRNRRQA